VCFRSSADFGATPVIYKICHKDEWAAAKHAGSYAGSANDAKDGFIHFSMAEQVAGTLARYYADADDLVLVAIDPNGLEGLRFEPSRDGALFPHLYGTLPIGHAVWVKPLTRGRDGCFALAGLLPE
jgi:uncharacterized protein (DUF952 family)